MDENKSLPLPWEPHKGSVTVPASGNIEQIVHHAVALKDHEKMQLVTAFQSGHFEIGSEFLWRRAMSRLKSTIAALGMRFVGEMLDRRDIDEYSNSENVLTDYDAIKLAEILGIVNSTGALRLRQGFELLSHLNSQEAHQDDERLIPSDAATLAHNTVKYILAEENFGVPIDFSNLRNRLTSETLQSADAQVLQLSVSPPFFQRTTLRVLLASIRNEKGAMMEHALSNLNLLLQLIWTNIPEPDRWSVGTLYTELSSLGNSPAVSSVKQALLKVKGFDYVHENVRSLTYKRAAQAVIAAHFGFNNFYNEVEPTRQLANLGTTIPSAAFADCMQAFIIVFIGNKYGISNAAAAIAGQELSKVSRDRWEYYLNKVFAYDDNVLFELTNNRPALNFITLANSLGFKQMNINAPGVIKLVSFDTANKVADLCAISSTLYMKLRQK